MLADTTTRPHPPSLSPHPSFAVADQGRGVYTVHEFDSWEHFRLWCRTHQPRHMAPLTYARGSRVRPDVDHRGEYTERMLHVQTRDARNPNQQSAIHNHQSIRLGHDADVDLVAMSDAERDRRNAARAAREVKRARIRGRQGLFNWCVTNNVNFDYVPRYLGMPLRDWEARNPEDTYNKAALLIELRRDEQLHPEVE